MSDLNEAQTRARLIDPALVDAGCLHGGWLALNEIDEATALRLFLLTTLNQMTPYLTGLAPAGTQPNLNTDIIEMVPISVPPVSIQRQFVTIVHRYERLHAQQREAERQAEHFYQTLLHRSFRGEL